MIESEIIKEKQKRQLEEKTEKYKQKMMLFEQEKKQIQKLEREQREQKALLDSVVKTSIEESRNTGGAMSRTSSVKKLVGLARSASKSVLDLSNELDPVDQTTSITNEGIRMRAEQL